MTGYDNRGARFPLTIVRGADLAFELTVTDANAAAVNLSAATIAGELYTTAGVLVDTLTAAVSGAGSNIVTLSLTDTETALLTATKMTWTLWVTRGGDKRPWLAGDVYMGDGTTGQSGATSGSQALTVDGDLSVSVEIAAIGSATATIRVEDEGVSTVAAATALNFVGSGVTVTDAGSNEATVTISSGGSGANLAWVAATSTVTSDSGTDATLTAVDDTNPGLMTVAMKTKLDGIEAAADVTDTANVTAAGALMDSEVDADIKTLALPANTTISAFGATLVDDADQSTARTTLGLGNAATLTVDADLATFVVPASTTISAFGATLVDDADQSTARTTLGLGTGATATIADYVAKATFPSSVSVAMSDMTTQITTGTTKAYWVNPFDTALTISKVKATLATAGSGSTVVDINEGAGTGTSILSTKITIEASETDSDDATTQPVISDTSIAADGRLTFDIDTAGTSAAGLMVHIMFTRAA